MSDISAPEHGSAAYSRSNLRRMHNMERFDRTFYEEVLYAHMFEYLERAWGMANDWPRSNNKKASP